MTIPPARALAVASRYTRGRVRSSSEVRTYLRRGGLSAEQAAAMVAVCQRRGWVDDRVCARLWADHWARRGYAWTAIRRKLAAKGLDEPTIDEAGRALDRAAGDAQRARALVQQRGMLSGRGIRRRFGGRPQELGRLARALAARGYADELIDEALSAADRSADDDAGE